MKAEQEQHFRDFVAARSPALLRTAYLLTGDAHLAQDLLQTALLACLRRWVRIRDHQQPEAYVRKAMYRHQVNWWRARARRPEALMAALPQPRTAGDHAADAVLRIGIIEALRSLPPRQRVVVVLRYYEDRSEADVAELLHISVGTVRSQASKALAKLRAAYPDLARPPDAADATTHDTTPRPIGRLAQEARR
jgi:RNA polymerase sigma-70 factor (sigma-E family)